MSKNVLGIALTFLSTLASYHGQIFQKSYFMQLFWKSLLLLLLFFTLMQYIGLSKVAGCRRKSLATWLVSASYSAWHFFTDAVFLKKYIPGLLSRLLRNFLTFLNTLQTLYWHWITSEVWVTLKKLNHLSPNIRLQILHTSLHTLP